MFTEKVKRGESAAQRKVRLKKERYIYDSVREKARRKRVRKKPKPPKKKKKKSFKYTQITDIKTDRELN